MVSRVRKYRSIEYAHFTYTQLAPSILPFFCLLTMMPLSAVRGWRDCYALTLDFRSSALSYKSWGP